MTRAECRARNPLLRSRGTLFSRGNDEEIEATPRIFCYRWADRYVFYVGCIDVGRYTNADERLRSPSAGSTRKTVLNHSFVHDVYGKATKVPSHFYVSHVRSKNTPPRTRLGGTFHVGLHGVDVDGLITLLLHCDFTSV